MFEILHHSLLESFCTIHFILFEHCNCPLPCYWTYVVVIWYCDANRLYLKMKWMDGKMNEMTLPSRHRIWNSSSVGLRPSTLPLGHWGSPQNESVRTKNDIDGSGIQSQPMSYPGATSCMQSPRRPPRRYLALVLILCLNMSCKKPLLSSVLPHVHVLPKGCKFRSPTIPTSHSISLHVTRDFFRINYLLHVATKC